MFFRKKRKPKPVAPDPKPLNHSPKPPPTAHREHYRREQSPRNPVHFKLRTAAGNEFVGEFLDASIRGAASLYTLANDPGLQLDEVVDLFISFEDRESGIQTPARVVYSEPGGDQHWRYAFEFVSVGNLYAQLDSFYVRLFNRRREQRITIPPEQTVKARLRWGANSIDCRVHDLSAGGMSTVLPDEKASSLQSIERLRISIDLPGGEIALTGAARICHRAQLEGRVMLGIQFDLDREDGFLQHQAVIIGFVDARRDEIERWERAIGAA